MEDIARIGLEEEEMVEEEEEKPTELNTINCSGGFLVVSTDKLSVKYTGINMHGHDVGAVQSNRPAPSKRLFYYFEMSVLCGGSKGHTAIGFTPPGYNMRRQPGWDPNSYGYHGDDGFLYHGQGKGDEFGPTFTTGDIVGAGINYTSHELFFTKNGIIVGKTSKNVKGILFPTISVHSQSEEVAVNFGKNPFVFDIKAFEAHERSKLQSLIEKISLPLDISYGIVRSYLFHYGYEETLNSFDLANKCTIPPVSLLQENGSGEQGVAHTLGQRKALRQLIRNGKMDDVFARLREWYPQIVQDDNSLTCFLLHCQKFIELVRVGELEEAVEHGRTELSKYIGSEFEHVVQDCVSLLAYEKAEKCPVGFLLRDAHMEMVADMVNAMILSGTRHDFLHSPLEILLKQLTACLFERRSLDGDQGEAFTLHRLLHANT